jgi:hypothetical protein
VRLLKLPKSFVAGNMFATTVVDKSITNAGGVKHPAKKRPPQRGALTSRLSWKTWVSLWVSESPDPF